MKITLAISCLILISCQSESSKIAHQKNVAIDKFSLNEAFETEPPQSAQPTTSPTYDLDKGSKIMKDGNLSFEVNKLENTKNYIDTILKKYNGYYEQEQYYAYGDRNTYALILRVPNDKFDKLIDDIESDVGQLKQKNIMAKNISEEYVDLNIRLENSTAYLNQYRELLKQVYTTSEILEMQENIRRIESDIESKKGRIRYLDNRVQYSKVSIELSELVVTKIASSTPAFGRRLINAASNGAQILSSIILGMISIWPIVLILGIIFAGIKALSPIKNAIKEK